MSLRRPRCSRERGARDAVRAQTHATGAAGPFEQVAPAPWLRETGRYDGHAHRPTPDGSAQPSRFGTGGSQAGPLMR